MEVLVERAVIVGVHEQKDQHFEYAMEELKNLAKAIDVEVVGEVTQNMEKRNPSTYVGKGKMEEIKNFYEELDANLVIFNDELSPSQIRNLERELDCKVIDRTMLILDIFVRRARTSESRMQVELAQLQYMLLDLLVYVHLSADRAAAQAAVSKIKGPVKQNWNSIAGKSKTRLQNLGVTLTM